MLVMEALLAFKLVVIGLLIDLQCDKLFVGLNIVRLPPKPPFITLLLLLLGV